LTNNLRFAFKHEPLDLRVIFAALQALGKTGIEGWVRSEPTGRYSRLAWFYYELFSGEMLELPSVKNAPYVETLDPRRHFVASGRRSERHHVLDNLLGGADLCPVLRRTRPLGDAIAARHDEQARQMTARYSPLLLHRAVSFLYTRETRSSFDIEGETPDKSREERFLIALQQAATFDPTDKEALIGLQNAIVERRYGATDWRDTQSYIGTRLRRGGENVHYVCPRPEDVPALMNGFSEMTRRTLDSDTLDPVLAAAVCAFAFVFIHPFEDGNGRIHRFLIHHALSKRGFTPPGLIFPVSAAILRERPHYERVLDAFSRPLLTAIDWSFVSDEDDVAVTNDTRDLYRFFDATPLASFLYDRVAETVTTDFKGELDYLATYDAAFTAIQRIVDIPDKRMSRLVQQCLQNSGRLSPKRHADYPELTPGELKRIEEAVQGVMREQSEEGERAASELPER
jgi:hypothetical protein